MGEGRALGQAVLDRPFPGEVPAGVPAVWQPEPMAANAVYFMVAQVGVNAGLFFSNLAIIRWYGAAEHGSVLMIVAVFNVFVALSDLGLASKAGVRAIARSRRVPGRLGRLLGELAAVQLAAAAVLVTTLVCAAVPISRWLGGSDPLVVRLAAAWLAASVVVNFCVMAFMGLEAMSNIAMVQPVAELGRLVCVLVCGLLGVGLIGVYAGWTAAYGLAAGVAVFRARRLLGPLHVGFRLRRIGIRRAIGRARSGLPFFVPFLSLFVLPFAGQLLTGACCSRREEVSLLQVSFLVASLPRMAGFSLANAIFPRIAEWHRLGREEAAADLLDQAGRLLGLMSTWLWALACPLAVPLLRAIYGEVYAEAADPLLVMLFAVAVENFGVQLDQALMAGRHAGLVAGVEVVKYVAFVGLGWLWAPRYGATGTAVALAGAMLLAAAVKTTVAKSRLNGMGGTSFLATIAVFGLLATTRWAGWNAWWALPVWGGASAGLMLLRPREIRGWLSAAIRIARRREP